ncbi:MAG: [FeFe] hydrogenase H-cluster radical SAM maturase HydE [Pirellulales bacterium]|nr:[FeFe] hydrogenase H-cluster radical SAM maturase HydE [Pirellulales bacterium]
MEHKEIINLLRETDPQRLDRLWNEADRTRREQVGDAVHLRGLIEFSNHCRRMCGYCGLRAENTSIVRYRMSQDEILAAAADAHSLGYGTVVLQSGEDTGLDVQWMCELIERIKHEMPLAVTLSLGERDESELAAWREAGADRYLLRFETSNRQLFDKIHPPRSGEFSDRVAILRTLDRLGYEVGSGVMIGIPGQTYEDLARDIALFAELDLDMIGVGPYIAHPDTPLGKASGEGSANGRLTRLSGSFALPDDGESVSNVDQVPNSEEMTYKVMALARLVCPGANIPSTTALATLNKTDGRELGLSRGANVIMPNVTPNKYRQLYEIYPDKACLQETAQACGFCIRRRIESIGRTFGAGRGDSANYRLRHGGRGQRTEDRGQKAEGRGQTVGIYKK